MRPRDRRGLVAQVHVVSQNRAGPRPRPAESRGALPAGGAASAVSSCCWAWSWPAWARPPTRPPPTGLWCNHLPVGTPRVSEACSPPPPGSTSSLPKACNCTNWPLGKGEPGPRPHESGFQSRNLRESHIAQARPRLRSPQTTSCPFLAPPARGSWRLHSPGLCCSTSPGPPPARCKPTSRPEAGAGIYLSRGRGHRLGYHGLGNQRLPSPSKTPPWLFTNPRPL